MARLLGRLKDKRFDFLCQLGDFDGEKLDLGDLVTEWIGHDSPLTVFDLGGVPSEVIDLVVALISRIVFEVTFWGRRLPGIGKRGPLFVVFEEAHLYLPKGDAGRFLQGFSRRAVQRFFKEGRKYGVGGMVISQRPSELDETVLSQCGTFFALRLSTPEDQSRVKAIVPDALSGLLDVLPALRTGEAIIMGEAVTIPSRIRLPLVDPRPRSDDPEVGKRWKEARVENPEFEAAVSGWRVQEEPQERTVEAGKE
jgi:DNA helicase HerA-like ATPase